jgi:hypothetical protein
MLAKAAVKEGADRISEETFAGVMPTFSQQRADFLAQEFELECPSLAQIIRSFAALWFDHDSFTATTQSMFEHLRSLPSAFSIQLRGETIRPDDDDQLFKLWNFLYNIELLNPRVSDKRQPKGYRHILPEEKPLLVYKSNWNEMEKMVWEVNPAFRDHIIHISDEERARFGLSRKHKERDRRRP